jgi:hypothetical protein
MTTDPRFLEPSGVEEVTEYMRKKLREPLSQEALKQHGSKTYLSSINPMYIIERLNDVFGIGAWRTQYEVLSANNGMIVVQGTLTIPKYGVYLQQFGGNDNGGEGSKQHDLGDAYKGAATDALNKIAQQLEIGIDIYKGKQNHKSTPAKTVAKPAQAKPQQEVKPSGQAELVKQYSDLYDQLPEAQKKAFVLKDEVRNDTERLKSGIKYLENLIKTSKNLKNK